MARRAAGGRAAGGRREAAGGSGRRAGEPREGGGEREVGMMGGMRTDLWRRVARNQTYKWHRNNGLKKKKNELFRSQKGMDPKFIRNLR